MRPAPPASRRRFAAAGHGESLRRSSAACQRTSLSHWEYTTILWFYKLYLRVFGKAAGWPAKCCMGEWKPLLPARSTEGGTPYGDFGPARTETPAIARQPHLVIFPGVTLRPSRCLGNGKIEKCLRKRRCNFRRRAWRYGGTSPPSLKLRRDKPAWDAAVSLGEHATGKAEISAQEAHGGRKISRPSCFTTSSFGLRARRSSESEGGNVCRD